MKQSNAIALAFLLCIIALLGWAPWLDEQALPDRVLQEKGRRDGTIVPESKIIGSEEVLQQIREESIRKA